MQTFLNMAQARIPWVAFVSFVQLSQEQPLTTLPHSTQPVESRKDNLMRQLCMPNRNKT